MELLKNLDKYIKDWHILTFLGLLVLGYVIYEYAMKQNMILTPYQGVSYEQKSTPASTGGNKQAVSGSQGLAGSQGPPGFAGDLDNLDGPAPVNNDPVVSTVPLTGGVNKDILNPSDLLPKDVNNSWAAGLAPDNELKNVDLLTAGHHVGINTVGSSLRNPNLQLRSEPANPRVENLCPWNNSTIDADNMRLPLEIGCKA